MPKSYAFAFGKLCFWTWKAMLSDTERYAFGSEKLCF